MKRFLCSLLLLVVLAPPTHAGRLSAGLEALISEKSGNEEIKVLVVMNDPPDVDIRTLDENLHALGAPRATRHVQIIDVLRDAAARSQFSLQSDLESARGDGLVRGYTSHWIVNGFVVVASVDFVRQLATRDDVDVIEPDLVVELIEPDQGPKGALGVPGLTPGVAALQADRVWTELGIDGTGTIVANMDTGVDGTHPALAARWRGNFAPVEECWHDALGGRPTPTDTHGHGTHTMGTITGQTSTDAIGVAPGALWIADNSIDQGVSSEFDNDVIRALEWFTDPDGNPNTLDDVPDVVQNSWGINEGFPGGYTDCDSRWWVAIDNCEAAGVVLTWSAGNEGPGGTSLRSPADRADSPYNAFSVGATLHSPPFTIASFSSRGPSGCGGPFQTKPEVCAPGVDILSSVPGGGYGFSSGTSMSGPHVAGVVALMRSANPDLDVQTIKQVLMDTATDLGPVGEENTYGHGFVDAYEAVLAVISGYGSIEGTVTDASNGSPLENVSVTISGDPRSAVTDATGFYRFILPEGTYPLQFAAFGYLTEVASVDVTADMTTFANIAMSLAPTARLSGTVRDFNGATVDGATVTVLNTPLAPATSQPDGTYEILLPDGATYDIRAFKPGLGPDTRSVAIAGDTVQDFALSELTWEGFETGDFTVLPWAMGGNADWFVTTADSYEGTYSARSGAITHNQVSSMSLDVTVRDPGEISFWYQVSSEASFDFLRFFIDGAQQSAWSGTVPWTQATYSITSGPHTFSWQYTKDGSVSSGSDAGFVDVVTLPPLAFPDIDIAPLGLTETLAPDETSTRGLVITNAGEGPLAFTTSLSGSLPPTGLAPVELAKDESDPREGVSPLLNSGGPDTYGYSWLDSDEPGGPAFNWVEINGIGTPIPLGDDSNSGPLNLGFAFNFYGTDYSSVRVCSNGWLSFTATNAPYTNDPIPDSTEPNALLATYWDDLNPLSGGTVYFYEDTPGQRFIVEWDAVPHYGGGGPQTFQAILNADGSILFQYKTVTGVTESTVGIENLDGTDGLQVVFNAAYLHDALAVVFRSVDPWVAVNPRFGTIEPQNQGSMKVDFNSADLEAGQYDALLTFTSNDPDESPWVVPITLIVDDATDVPAVAAPTSFSLSRAYPNPFGRRTAIGFSVPAGGGDVELIVFDVTGRRVRALVRGPQPAGRHLAVWDGTDEGGNRVAAGAYFYRLRAEEFESTRRMVRLR